MSEQYEVRRVGEHGRSGHSLVVTIPHKFLAGTNIGRRDYVKFYREQHKIVMEKFQESDSNK